MYACLVRTIALWAYKRYDMDRICHSIFPKIHSCTYGFFLAGECQTCNIQGLLSRERGILNETRSGKIAYQRQVYGMEDFVHAQFFNFIQKREICVFYSLAKHCQCDESEIELY